MFVRQNDSVYEAGQKSAWRTPVIIERSPSSSFLDGFWFADDASEIVGAVAGCWAQAIIAATHGADLWHETRAV